VKLIVGLGNPGPKYEKTRHNAGFLILDQLLTHAGGKWDQEKFQGVIGKGQLNGETCLFVKPMTFMNVSGKCVGPLAHFYKIEPKDIIAIYDDIDVPSGKVKARVGGSAGGHNGIKSLIEDLGSENFHRIKLGVGKPVGIGAQDVVKTWVLSPFSKEELEHMQKSMFEDVLVRLQNILVGG
jgi:PTH1 family peptidyl-tRNA hydrolase